MYVPIITAKNRVQKRGGTGPSNDGTSNDGPSNDGPSNDGPSNDVPSNDVSSYDGPSIYRSAPPVQDNTGGEGMAWILLFTYICLLVYNLGFCYWAFEFGSNLNSTNYSALDEEPATHSVDPTINTDGRRETLTNDTNNRLKRDVDGPYEVDGGPLDYNYDYNDRSETYVYLSCGTSAIITGVVILSGICSRTIFLTTMPMHASVLTVALHMGTLIAVLHHKNLIDSIWIILGANTGAVILNGLQVFLNVIHLRRQSIPVATYNFIKQFSFTAIFFIARIVLSAIVLQSFFYSNFWSASSGSVEPCGLSQGIPAAYFCAITTIVALLLNANGLLSFIFGSFPHLWATVVTFVLVCGYTGICVLASPLLASSEYTSQFSTKPLNLAIACTIVHAVHFVFLCHPKHLSTNIFDFLRIVASRTLESSFFGIFRRINEDELQTPPKSFFWQNVVSFVVSLVTLALSAVSLSRYGGWYNALLLAVAATLFSRSGVVTLSQILTASPDPTTTVQKLLFLVLEGTITLVALIASCFYKGISIAAAAILLIAYAILAIHVFTSPFVEAVLERLFPSQPILQTTLIEEDIPSGSRPHQSEVDVDVGGDGGDDENLEVKLEAE